MNTYVMSDIHGCYDKFMEMLEKIKFSAADQLIIAGDYLDRGSQNYEMLNWVLHAPENVLLLRGNHDEEFVTNVELMQQVLETEMEDLDIKSAAAAKQLYQLTKHLFSEDGEDSCYHLFDYYGTVQELIDNHGACFRDLARWAVALDEMPYLYKLKIGDRPCVVVHAGYIDKLEGAQMEKDYFSIEDFYLYARKDAYIHGGILHGMVIAGHTPTLAENEMSFNHGEVFRFYHKEKDCIFYDIDCGCAYAKVRADAKLACIRLEDEKIFYV